MLHPGADHVVNPFPYRDLRRWRRVTGAVGAVQAQIAQALPRVLVIVHFSREEGHHRHLILVQLLVNGLPLHHVDHLLLRVKPQHPLQGLLLPLQLQGG